jgi:4-amino-4-deoxy-L-arabinose transferase
MSHPLTPTLYDNPVLDYDYRNWGQNHIWLHKPPLSLWLMALSMKLFGINEIALRLPSIILSTLAIFFTFYIGTSLFSNKVGLLAAFFHSINGFLIELSSGRIPTDHVDTIFIFFVELGIFLSVVYAKTGNNKVLLPIGIASGLAVLTKWFMGFLIFPVWWALVLHKERFMTIMVKSSLMFIVCLIILVPWQLHINHSFPAQAVWENHYNLSHILGALEGHSGTVLYHIVRMPRYFGELVYIPILWFLLLVLQGKNSKLLSIAVWLLVPYILFSIVATKMPAYVMISAPAIFLIEACFWWQLRDRKFWLKYKTLSIVLLLLLLLLPARYCIERTKPHKDYDRNPKWAKELRTLEDKVGSRNSVLFNIDRPIEAMFYSRYTAYSFIPTEEQIKELNEKDYEVVIYDTGSLPDNIQDNKKVIILKGSE